MTLRAAVRELVRQRAGFACEYCGVNETDVGRRNQQREKLLRRYLDVTDVHETLLEHQTELMEQIGRLLGEQQQLLRRRVVQGSLDEHLGDTESDLGACQQIL